MSWIHIDDLVDLILFAIDTPSMRGAVNATSPGAVSHGAFVAALSAQCGGGLRLHLPAGLLRKLAGEMSCLFLASQRVLPEVAIGHGFQFHHAEIAEALSDLFRSSAAPVDVPATAYLNEECAVCSAQLGFCHRIGERHGGSFALRPVGGTPNVMADYGLSEGQIRRRLFVVDGAGRARSGVDAVLHLWSGLPYFRWAARVIAVPGLRHFGELIYEGVLVPVLAAWNGRYRPEVRRHGCR
jgi:predicted DCC family thiol-disulfide oxidoreductase YuxK